MITTILLAAALTYVDPSPVIHYGEYTTGGIAEFNSVLLLTYQGRAEMRGPYANDGGRTEYLWRCLDQETPCEISRHGR